MTPQLEAVLGQVCIDSRRNSSDVPSQGDTGRAEGPSDAGPQRRSKGTTLVIIIYIPVTLMSWLHVNRVIPIQSLRFHGTP